MNYKSVYFPKYINSDIDEVRIEKGPSSISYHHIPLLCLHNRSMLFKFKPSTPDSIINRDIHISSDCIISMKVNLVGTMSELNGTPVVEFGKDITLCPLPLNSLIKKTTVKINDCCISHPHSIHNELLLLKKDEPYTCPSETDKVAIYRNMHAFNNLPNRYYNDIVFCYPDGSELPNCNTIYVDSLGEEIYVMDGIPVIGNEKTVYDIYFKFKSREKLMSSPFISDGNVKYKNSGLGMYNVDNLEISLALKDDVSRIIRSLYLNKTIKNVKILNNNSFMNTSLDITTMIPHASIDVPPRSISKYVEISRYKSYSGIKVFPGETFRLMLDNITLPRFPYKIMIYIKKKSYKNYEGEYYFPITNVSIDIGSNFNSLKELSQEQLYCMSKKNGLNIGWESFRGYRKYNNRTVQLTSGPVIVMPGKDFSLKHNEALNMGENTNFGIIVEAKNIATINQYIVLHVVFFNENTLVSQDKNSIIIKSLFHSSDIQDN